jgi:hypothetical protein
MRTSQSAGESHLGASAPGAGASQALACGEAALTIRVCSASGATAKEHRKLLGQGSSASAVRAFVAREVLGRVRGQRRLPRRSNPAVVGDASQTKATARRWKTSEFATTFVKRKVDRFECRNRRGIDPCEDGARETVNANTSRIEVSDAETRRVAKKRRRDDRVRQGGDEARAAR